MHTHQYIQLTDEELLLRYRKSKDKEWLAVLLERYTLLLLGVAMKYLKNKTLAEDAVQQIFLKTFTKLPDEPIQNFKGWLYILMRNHCLLELRNTRYTIAVEDMEIPAHQNVDISTDMEKEFSLHQMYKALERLNPEQKLSIELFYLQKKSYQEIIDQTGFTFKQVKSYIQNGKRNLKLILQQKLNKDSE